MCPSPRITKHNCEVAFGAVVTRSPGYLLVLPDEALGANLLGMSFLSKVRWTYERGKLVLEQ